MIDVDEKGSEAVAATAIVMAPTAAIGPQTPPVVFRADHPFIYLIRATGNDEILFLGRLVAPTAP